MAARDQHLPYWARRPAFVSAQKEAMPPLLSSSTAALLKAEFFAGIVGIFAGGMAQLMMALDIFPVPAPPLAAIGGSVFLLPLFALWLPVFCNQPLISLPAYVRWCFYMSCCSVGAALVFELYHAVGWLPVRSAGVFAVARIVMYAGWISFVPQLHYWTLRKKSTLS